MPFLSVVGRSRPNTPASSRAPSPSPAPEPSLPLPPLPLPSLPLPPPHDLNQDDMPNPLEIILPTDTIVLRGTGTHTEPTAFSGSVVLNLPEAMALKSLTLVLRGKSKIPAPPGWDSSARQSHHTSEVFTYSISFLKGESAVHTLKAGRNEFPFSITLDGTNMPSTIQPPPHTAKNYIGSTITYKLRATAVRPKFSTNFTSTRPVSVIRSFMTDALEYQQTLEIESSWPNKLMYSLMIPHKSWAAGDSIATLFKFSPLRKGIRVASIHASLQEKSRTKWRSIEHEDTRLVAQARHDIVDGKPVLDVPSRPGGSSRIGRAGAGGAASSSAPAASGSRLHAPHVPDSTTPSTSVTASTSTSAVAALASASSATASAPLPILRPELRTHSSGGLQNSPPALIIDDEPSRLSSSPVRESPNSGGEGDQEGEEPPDAAEGEMEMMDLEPSSDLTFTTLLPLPAHIFPSTPLAPVVITYRVKWTITIFNPEGHTSELRCSLPVHILHSSLLRESWSATRAIREALLGEGGEWMEGSGGLFGNGAEGAEDVEALTLPAYRDHILDRVPVSMHHLHDVATAGVPGTGATVATTAINPLRTSTTSSIMGSRAGSAAATPAERAAAASGSYFAPHAASTVHFAVQPELEGLSTGGSSALPRSSSMPDASEMGQRRGREREVASVPSRSRNGTAATAAGHAHQNSLLLEMDQRRAALIDSELLVSLGSAGARNVIGNATGGNGSASANGSRASSRASSPERDSRLSGFIRPSLSRPSLSSRPSTASSSSGRTPSSITTSGSSAMLHTRHGIFNLKPFTPFSSSGGKDDEGESKIKTKDKGKGKDKSSIPSSGSTFSLVPGRKSEDTGRNTPSNKTKVGKRPRTAPSAGAGSASVFGLSLSARTSAEEDRDGEGASGLSSAVHSTASSRVHSGASSRAPSPESSLPTSPEIHQSSRLRTSSSSHQLRKVGSSGRLRTSNSSSQLRSPPPVPAPPPVPGSGFFGASTSNLHKMLIRERDIQRERQHRAASSLDVSTRSMERGRARGGGEDLRREETQEERAAADLQLLSELYSTVPDYTTAARGFLGGGVTPLTTLRGLPSYDEAQRQRSATATPAPGPAVLPPSSSSSSSSSSPSSSSQAIPIAERPALSSRPSSDSTASSSGADGGSNDHLTTIRSPRSSPPVPRRPIPAIPPPTISISHMPPSLST